MTTTLAALQTTFTNDVDLISVSRDSRSGGEWADLLRRMWQADSRCNVCNLDTVQTASRNPQAARLMVLVPCVLSDDNGGRDRFGYVPGNLALACKACVDARNAYMTATGDALVMTPDALAEGGARVWLDWPGLGKRKGAATQHTEEARLARVAAGLVF